MGDDRRHRLSGEVTFRSRRSAAAEVGAAGRGRSPSPERRPTNISEASPKRPSNVEASSAAPSLRLSARDDCSPRQIRLQEIQSELMRRAPAGCAIQATSGPCASQRFPVAVDLFAMPTMRPQPTAPSVSFLVRRRGYFMRCASCVSHPVAMKPFSPTLGSGLASRRRNAFKLRRRTEHFYMPKADKDERRELQRSGRAAVAGEQFQQHHRIDRLDE